MTASIISALNILTKPLIETPRCDAHPSKQVALLAALQTNQTLLLKQLEDNKELEEVRRLRQQVKAGVTWFSTDAEDPTWHYVQECLLLLLALAQHLKVQLELFNQAPVPPVARLRTPEMAPPLPPDILSVSQEKTVGAALQFVISLGLCPYLAPGVGLSLGRRSAFGTVVESVVRGDVPPTAERRLLTTTSVLLQLTELSSFATLLFTRHLGDALAALCQLGYRPHRPNGCSKKEVEEVTIEERKTCREALQSLLGKVYQPIVIKELLILQGGPKQSPAVPGSSARTPLAVAPPWLRRLCGQLLSVRLMQPSGVQSVVRAILEGTTGGDTDWRKCDGVAKILSACPQQSATADSYYRQVCPQILELLHFKDKLTAQQFQRVATRAALTMVEEKPQFAQQYLLAPLLQPLQRCGTAKGGDGVVEELELTRCVDDLYKLCVVGNSPLAPLLKAIKEVLPVIFSLFCFSRQGVCHLRAPCQEILLWYLGHTEPFTALEDLHLLSGLARQTDKQTDEQTDGRTGRQVYQVAAEVHFTPGGEGGARLSRREAISDDDDALYERLSGEQWKLECLVHLLAELKDSHLPGDFFLRLLQELTCWALEEDEEEEEVDMSAMTLLEAEQHLSGLTQGRGQRLVLLQVLAALCEGLPHTLLLKKTTQVVEFLVSLLQRACAGLDCCPGSGTENPVESQTLSMAMGLVATLLSGPQLRAEDYSSMSRLLPPLEELSRLHPEAVIQELASNLRTVIATHGAYRPETLAHPVNPKPRDTNSVPCKIKPKTQPQNRDAHVSPDHHHSSTTQVNSSSSFTASVPGAHYTTSLQKTEAPDHGSPKASSTIGSPRGRHSAQAQAEPLIHGQAKHDKPPWVPTHGGSMPDGSQAERKYSGTNDPAPPSQAFSDSLMEACDPDVPTRAVALRALTQMIKEGNTEAIGAQEKVLLLFLENLKHEDSFVYLSAIQGLALLADQFPERILQRLLGEYQHGPAVPASDQERRETRSLETRLKVGEVLMRASRAMGDLAPHLGRPLIGVFLQGVRDQDQTVRASSLSNLGELCQRLDYSLGPLAQELSCCLSALIKTEKEAEVRRAAVHVITLLLRGLSNKTTQVLGDVLLDLYRALKWVVRSDPDKVTVLHAQLALEELDDVMRKFIFPQQKLEKKIVVLP